MWLLLRCSLPWVTLSCHMFENESSEDHVFPEKNPASRQMRSTAVSWVTEQYIQHIRGTLLCTDRNSRPAHETSLVTWLACGLMWSSVLLAEVPGAKPTVVTSAVI